MAKLLYIDACIREESSRTRALAKAYLDAYRAAHPQDAIETVNLSRTALKPFDFAALKARETACGRWDDAQFAVARQLRCADRIVIAAPFWNGTFPAALHVYFEHVCVAGLTFNCIDDRYEGLCRARECVLLTTRGGVYETGTPQLTEEATPFLKSLMTMLGVPRVRVIAAEGLDLAGNDAQALLDAAKKKAAQAAFGVSEK